MVTSCLSKIMRILALQAPYDDSTMKEVFPLLVDSFQDLDEMKVLTFLELLPYLKHLQKSD